jgi:phage terminase small subunit
MTTRRAMGGPGHRRPGLTSNDKRLGRTDQTKPLEGIASITVPDHLDHAGRELWEHVGETAPWVAETDSAMLLVTCELADLRAVTRTWLRNNADGITSTMLRTISDQDARFIRALAELGLTPASRTAQGVGAVKIASKLEQFRADEPPPLQVVGDDDTFHGDD